MTKNREDMMEKYDILNFDKDLFLMLHNESSKVIDFCKQQQWYVVGLGVGIHFGMIVVSQEYFQILPCFQFLLSLIMIGVSSIIPFVGLFVLLNLFNKTSEHRTAISKLKTNYLKLPPELLSTYVKTPDNQTNNRDIVFILLFSASLFISSFICSLIILGGMSFL
jgi:hypothetical protein